MKKVFMVTLMFVLLAGTFLAKPSPVQAYYKPDSTVAEGEWNTGTSGFFDFTGTTFPVWLMPLTPAVTVDGATQLCHPFRGGLLGWTGEIMQLVDGNWVKLATTTGWIPDEEGAYMACAMVPAGGTYALFGYYDPAKVPVVVPSYCNSGKWWGNYYNEWLGDGEYYLSIQFPSNFPEDVEFNYVVTSVTGNVDINVGDSGSQYTYLYEDGYIYVDFDQMFTISPDDPGGEGTPWSVTFATHIRGCSENVTITNADYWGWVNED